ncbi:DUF1501 domain-containing protein [Nocardioides marmoribigeumensis]|uniref:Uncharacterized protein (DUF1501 family) n=3 Tax=Nocardioides marmoribigeumensis TaxID=433649 RepID=A0ABU2BTY9_9ACTN|nr:DUF1501 domain-containing protein [Nocardioides marmoribigeumensis]MDR7362093.1 uncharacterized protein (DUF1501 family) [Nocardioides marmoribigeumensis]
MTTPDCCTDYLRAASVSRRRFLGGMAAAGATGVVTSVFGDAVRQASYAATTGGNVLVVLSLRGGVDGLGVVVPHGDPAYVDARGTLALPTAPLLAKDSTFGLHPELAPLQWLWDAGQMAAVQAVGLKVPNRSHFAAMELVEDADPTSSVRRGWVNRMIGLDTDVSAVEAVHMGDTMPPTMIEGPAPTLATNGLSDIGLIGADDGYAARRRTQLNTMWGGNTGPLGNATRSALEAVSTLSGVGKYTPSVAYPTGWPGTDLSKALKDTAALIKADVGTEVVSIDFGSWDMHDGYGTLGWGRMQEMLGAFAASVSAFMRDLGPLRSKVTVVTISEFGRRVAPNGNGGLDHGWGNMMLLMGGGVRGGYHGRWPGLDQLTDGDLSVTTDYRQVLGEVVAKRFPGKSVSQVFPGLVQKPLGVLV